MKSLNFQEFEALVELAKKSGLVHKEKSKSPYQIKKEQGGQYYAKFADGSDDFFLNAETRAEAIEEAQGYEAEGLFNKSSSSPKP